MVGTNMIFILFSHLLCWLSEATAKEKDFPLAKYEQQMSQRPTEKTGKNKKSYQAQGINRRVSIILSFETFNNSLIRSFFHCLLISSINSLIFYSFFLSSIHSFQFYESM